MLWVVRFTIFWGNTFFINKLAKLEHHLGRFTPFGACTIFSWHILWFSLFGFGGIDTTLCIFDVTLGIFDACFDFIDEIPHFLGIHMRSWNFFLSQHWVHQIKHGLLMADQRFDLGYQGNPCNIVEPKHTTTIWSWYFGRKIWYTHSRLNQTTHKPPKLKGILYQATSSVQLRIPRSEICCLQLGISLMNPFNLGWLSVRLVCTNLSWNNWRISIVVQIGNFFSKVLSPCSASSTGDFSFLFFFCFKDPVFRSKVGIVLLISPSCFANRAFPAASRTLPEMEALNIKTNR